MLSSTLVTCGAVCAVLASLPGSTPAAETDTRNGAPSRVYTNADLERVAPYRDQTGVASVAASSTRDTGGEPTRTRDRARGSGRQQRVDPLRDPLDDEAAARQRDEAYWRREAARHQQRQRQLAGQIAALQRQAGRGKRGSTSASRAHKEEQLRDLEERRREEDEAFEERARRAGALPGWLR